MRPRRRYIARKVYFASDRIREGLPLVPDELINAVILSILARAQHQYPLTICDYVFMSNHFHLILVCFDPKVVSSFFGYVKGELASAINKLLGRRGTVWEGRSDVVRVVSVESIIEKTIYLYTNPQTAGLVDTIEQYPGVNSWKAFMDGQSEQICPWYMTRALSKIPQVPGECRLRQALIENLKRESSTGEVEPRKESSFKVEPLGWVKYFDNEITQAQAKERIVTGVREREAALRKTRRSLIGRQQLIQQSMYKRYRPKKFGKRVFIICHDKELRKELIDDYRQFVRECTRIFQNWVKGDFSRFFPPGAFAPPAFRIASALA